MEGSGFFDVHVIGPDNDFNIPDVGLRVLLCIERCVAGQFWLLICQLTLLHLIFKNTHLF